jgi:thioredoxin-related protein
MSSRAWRRDALPIALLIAIAAADLAAQDPAPAAEATAELPWIADVAKAKEQAKREKKDLFIDFTGSDWCGWCVRLDREVFKTPAFVAAARDKFVFLYLDFPNSDEAKAKVVDEKMNESLREKYGVQGFPSILLCDADGNPYARTGYQPGGPEKYLAHIEELRAGGEKLKALLANQDEAKAEELLVAAFPVLSTQDLLAFPEYGKFLTAAEKVESLAKQVKAIRAQKELLGMLSTGPAPDWKKVHEFLGANPDLSGPDFLNACWGCANEHLAKSGDYAGATKLLQRMLADPLLASNDQGKQMIEEKLAEFEKLSGGQ